jgi:hypothetical protein
MKVLSIRSTSLLLLLVMLSGHSAIAHAQPDPAFIPMKQSETLPVPIEETAPNSTDPSELSVEAPPTPVITSPDPPIPQPPEDPCLPRLFHNWQELGTMGHEGDEEREFRSIKLLIDRSNFMLTVVGELRDGSLDEVYQTHIGLGDTDTPTPAGRFIINHVYCYPDVVYFDANGEAVPRLYKGFLAPLMRCGKAGKCTRFRALGIHGFDASAYPDSDQFYEQTYGPVSGGCIRVPDPCELKELLIRLVGVGPTRKNDRGCYHWLNHPVEVLIDGEYPWFNENSTVGSLFSNGLTRVHSGLKRFLGIFAP